MSIIFQFVSGRLPNIFRNAEGIIFNALSVAFREDDLSATQINLQPFLPDTDMEGPS